MNKVTQQASRSYRSTVEVKRVSRRLSEELELQQNAWLICDATAKLVFETLDHMKWHAALDSIGIDPRLLSASGGRA